MYFVPVKEASDLNVFYRVKEALTINGTNLNRL